MRVPGGENTGATAEVACGQPKAGVVFQTSCTVGELLTVTPQ